MPTANPSAPPAAASRIRVAIVEDDDAIREILRTWIAATPEFEMTEAFANTEVALAALPALQPAVALVDINLPGLSGIECVARLKPKLPETQFVMLTVYEDANHIFNALAVGATGYLLKRTARDELIRALLEVHGGGSPMSSNIARMVVQSLRQPREAEALAPREHEVLGLLAQGFLYKEIADQLAISLPTVNTYIRRIYEKLHVHSRAQAVRFYVPRRPVE
jgi:DNA-binding NarL/FixJ family response regulator